MAECLYFRFHAPLTANIRFNVTICMGNNRCVADFALRLQAIFRCMAPRLNACLLYICKQGMLTGFMAFFSAAVGATAFGGSSVLAVWPEVVSVAALAASAHSLNRSINQIHNHCQWKFRFIKLPIGIQIHYCCR